MQFRIVTILLFMAGFLVSCSESDNTSPTMSTGEDDTVNPLVTSAEVSNASENPFFNPSPLYFNYPQFDLIRNEHYLPAFERGIAEQLIEIEAIAEQDAAPTFENTILAMELSGQLLQRVSSVFYSLAGAHTNDDIQALQQELAPRMAAHDDSIVLNPLLFDRINTIYETRSELAPESARLVEKYYVDFVRAGAALNPGQQERMRELNAQIALQRTLFSQNVLSEVNDLAIVVDSREELTGLDDTAIGAAAEEAQSRDLPGKFVIPLLNTSGQPALAKLQNRALRERILQTSLSRGSRGGAFDNREAISTILRLRAERAQLLGYDNHAQYVLEDETAGSVAAVNQRLAELAPPAVANARREATDLQAQLEDSGGDFNLAAWDWDFYAEKLGVERFEFDDAQLRPYFELDNVLTNGLFFAAEQLYGISFQERTDLPVYQEDVRVFEVFDAVGTTLALFLGDYYARSSKGGGAWMNAYLSQNDLLNTQPVVANHLNITEPPEGQPTLLSFGEVTTLFHEFGHALHGMFSNVDYPYFSGTRVPRDFVEYPSQVNEMWATWPEVLENYAVHYQTGEPMPTELLQKVLSARQFNQGFATTEYLAASLLDQSFHQLTPEQVP
ncbi:MAG TPA: M3 family metallopeptidase, partial [Gammaproteobacteria bacterium]|nr:M3 family metallopeptidase [Gammaproteobacteria bacterium]